MWGALGLIPGAAKGWLASDTAVASVAVYGSFRYHFQLVLLAFRLFSA